MEQVFAESAFGNHAFEVLCGRRNDADIHLHTLCSTHTLKLLINQNTQNLVLRLARHIGNFIEIENAAMRFFKRTDFTLSAIHFCAKQLDFHTLWRNGRSIDCHKRSIRAG